MNRSPYAPPDAPVADTAVDPPSPEGWRNARILATHFAAAAAFVVAAVILFAGLFVDHSDHPYRFPMRKEAPVAALFLGFLMFVWSWLVSAVTTKAIRAATPGSRWGGIFLGALFSAFTIAIGNAFDGSDAGFRNMLLLLGVWGLLYPALSAYLLTRV